MDKPPPHASGGFEVRALCLGINSVDLLLIARLT